MTLQTIQKIGPVLDLFTPERPEWGVGEVAGELGTPKSSTHAILASLAGTGLLASTSRGRYRIGWRIIELSETLRATTDIREHAAPIMQQLVTEFGETVHLGVIERGKVLYIDKVVGHHVVNVLGARVGTHLDVHCTGVGKVLLAYRDPVEIERWLARAELPRLTAATITDPVVLRNELQQIRLAGCAYDHGEAVPDVHCVAAPVKDDLGTVIAALSMTVPAGRFLPRRAEFKRRVVAAARQISTRLTHLSDPPGVVRPLPNHRPSG